MFSCHNFDNPEAFNGPTLRARSQDCNVTAQVAQGQWDGREQSARDNAGQQCRQWHGLAVEQSSDNVALVNHNDNRLRQQ
eukprot:232725-Amphidinium_carterae.2